MQLEQRLVALGLNEKEATTYLGLLSMGSSAVSEIAKSTKINRSTTYLLLGDLLKKGLVSTSKKKKILLYSSAPPERLIQLLEERVAKTNSLLSLARGMLPELKSVFSGVGPKPKVSFFEGAEGIRTIYEDTLNSSETILAYASIENMHEALPDYFPNYYKRRAANGIHIRSIHPDTPEARDRMKHNKEESRESILVPKEQYGFSPEINMYDNKITFMSLREKFGLIVESEELTIAMKKIFELSWLGAKKIYDSTRHVKE